MTSPVFNRKSRTTGILILLIVVLGMLAGAAAAIYNATASTPFVQRPIEFESTASAEIEVAPEQFRFRSDITPELAVAMNAKIPVSDNLSTPAKPFVLGAFATSVQTRLLAIDCLTAAVYYEAASETRTGQHAVAQVVLNRMRHPAYQNSICGVVFEGSQRVTGCQFSFTCDGSLTRKPSTDGWSRARAVALLALAGYVEPSVGLATHYHTIWVVPYWSSSLTKVKTIGAHIFYRWTGQNGMPAAFTKAYAAIEYQPSIAVEAKASQSFAQLNGNLDVPETGNESSSASPPATDSAPSISDTGLLIAPATRIKRTDQQIVDSRAIAKDSGIISDKDRNAIRSESTTLLIDRNK